MDDKINAEKTKAAEDYIAIPKNEIAKVISEISERPLTLKGKTYKLKTPLLKEAFYITINDIEENGKVRPYEIFINSKNLQHFSWLVALTRMISAILRKDNLSEFLIPELKSIFDPSGGYFKNGKYIPSLVSEIGDVIEAHLNSIKK